ncbi:MAG TPA: hypothetical protein VGB85_02065 [Nannocystis sp.]
MRRLPCAYLPLVAALAGGCFNPAGSGETSAGSTGSPEVTSSSTGDAPTTSTTSTTGAEPTTTTPTGSSGPESSSSEPASTGVLPGTDTTDASDTSSTTDEETTDTGDTTGGAGICGNGAREPGEGCDDHNTNDGDGCSAVCRREDLVVFVTSESFSVGQIMNLGVADNLCIGRSQLGSAVPGRAKGSQYIAWLSDGFTSAVERLVDSSVAYRRVDGTTVANGTADLLDSDLLQPINVDENGVVTSEDRAVCGDAYAWTGTHAWGMTTADQCDQWVTETDESFATAGNMLSTTQTWSEAMYCTCDKKLRLYCIEVG